MSSTTLEWAMAELHRRPELLARARDEITTVIGSVREVEESDISRLRFLQALLKETFPLHPTIPLLLAHKAEESTEINGYMVPKYSQVGSHILSIPPARVLCDGKQPMGGAPTTLIFRAPKLYSFYQG